MPSEVSEVREQQLVAVTITGEGAFIDSERIEPPDEDADLQDVVLDAVTHRFAEPSGQAVRVIAWDGHALMTFLLRPNGTTSEIVPVYVGDRLAQAYAFRTIGIPRPEPRPGFFARLRQGMSRPRQADSEPTESVDAKVGVESKVDLEKPAEAAAAVAAAQVLDQPVVAAEPEVEPEPVAATDTDVAAEPVAEDADEPVAKVEVEPVIEPIASAETEADVEPAVEPVAEAADEPVAEADPEPAVEPVAEAADEPVDESPDLPATDLVEAAFGPPDAGAAEGEPGDADENTDENAVDVPVDSPVDDEFSWAAFAKSLDTPYGVFSEPDVSDVPRTPDLSPPETPRTSPFAGLGSFKTAGELAGDMSDELEFQPEFGPEFQTSFAAHAPKEQPSTFEPADWATEIEALALTGGAATEPDLETVPDLETEPEMVAAVDADVDFEPDTEPDTDLGTDLETAQEPDEDDEEAPVPVFFTPVDDRRRRKGALVAVLVVALIGLFSAGAWALTAGRGDDSPTDTAASSPPLSTEAAPVSTAPVVVTSPPKPMRLTTKVKGGHARVDALVTLPGRATTLVSLVIAYTDAGGDQRFLRQTVRLHGGTTTRVSMNDVRPGDWEWWVKGEQVATAHGEVTVLPDLPPKTAESTPTPTSDSTPVSEPTYSPTPTSEPTTSPTSSGPTGPVDPGSSSPPPTGPVPGG